jgi:hypothetical protein
MRGVLPGYGAAAVACCYRYKNVQWDVY